MRRLPEVLTIGALRAAYREDGVPIRSIVEEVYDRSERSDADPAIWITRVERRDALERADALEAAREVGRDLPLLGVPFAVKDNIDVAGLPTTAACPAFAYTPERNATVVERLLDAGALLIGKTNLDQFATGLVGVRSPHGVPRSVYNREYISGGSSSGSAVAAASGQVAFALGTDTAGSGRVPAAFNNLVGLKPTRGTISTRGVVPACRSLDCVSILTHDAADALAVLGVAAGYDPEDPYSRTTPHREPGGDRASASDFTFGLPAPGHLDFLGDEEAAALFDMAVARLEAIGGRPVTVDLEPFLEAAALLYTGPWVAERDAAFGDFIRGNPSRVDPTVLSIVSNGQRTSGADVFRGLHRLEALKRRTETAMASIDALALPTTPTTYRVDEVLSDPLTLNANLGRYTNFMNLLDLAGIALPAGFRRNRTAAGITLVGRPFSDAALAAIGERYGEVYAREIQPPPLDRSPIPGRIRVAVVGAHLQGQPLNHQLTARGARLIRSTRTAPTYRLFALAGTGPAKPGLVHADLGGASIEIEIWELEEGAFGSFVAQVPAPLAIGTLDLEDGSTEKGFVCEPRALIDAEEITHFGGWRAYRAEAG